MALATLSIDLVAQLASLQTGMDKAGRIAEKNAAQIEARYQKMAGAARAVGAVLAGAFSVAGIAAFVRSTVDGLDALNDLADATGSSVENLSALEDIAARTGTSMDTVGAAVVKLNQALGNSKPGDDVSKSLQAIGLEADALKKVDPSEALRQIAVALAGFADDGNKARLVQELFGKSIREVAPLLKDLAAAGQLNATVTAEQAKQAEEFNQQLSRLGKNATDAARSITGPLITSINQFAQKMRELQASKGGFLGGLADQFGADYARARLQATTEELQRLTPAAERARRLLAEQPDSIRAKSTLAEFEQLKRDAEQYRTEIDAILYGGGKRRPANEGGGKLAVPVLPELSASAGKAGKVAKAAGGFVGPELPDNIAAALRRLEQTDAGKLAKLRAELTDLLTLQAGGVGGGVAQAVSELSAEIDKLVQEGRGPAITDSLEAMRSAFLQSEKAAYEFGEETVAALEQVSVFADEAARNIQDALGDSLTQALKGDFDSIGDLWVDMLTRMAAEAAAAQIAQALFGAGPGKGGEGAGYIGDFLKLLSAGFGGARADGGPVTAGRAYLVGERGPELIVPRGSGTVIPNGAGGTAFNSTIVVQGDASANTLRLIRQSQQQMAAQMRYRERF